MGVLLFWITRVLYQELQQGADDLVLCLEIQEALLFQKLLQRALELGGQLLILGSFAVHDGHHDGIHHSRDIVILTNPQKDF